MPREVDGKDASRIREVARIDPAMVRFNGPPAEREAKTETCSIRAVLLERTEQVVDVAARKAAAFVLDLDQNPLGAGARPQRDLGSRPGELEGILQQVHHDGSENLSIAFD